MVIFFLLQNSTPTWIRKCQATLLWIVSMIFQKYSYAAILLGIGHILDFSFQPLWIGENWHLKNRRKCFHKLQVLFAKFVLKYHLIQIDTGGAISAGQMSEEMKIWLKLPTSEGQASTQRRFLQKSKFSNWANALWEMGNEVKWTVAECSDILSDCT